MADPADNTNADTGGVNFFVFIPTEIITLVLTQPDLSFRDVVNFGATCKSCHSITSDNELWKVKLLTRWPCLRHFSETTKPTSAWLDHCRQLHNLPETARDLVACLSAKCFHKEEVTYSHFKPLKELYLRNELCRALTDEVLMAIVNDEKHHKDLTLRYYAQKALRYVRHMQLRQEWQAYFGLPIEQQKLLEGAILFERWYNPFSPSPEESVRKEVKEIAERARRKLKTDHPCCHGNVEGVVEMTPNQCQDVLDAVNEVLIKEMNFQGNSEDYYNESNSFMSLVLTRKLGIPITLCILYEAVVRRLGLVLRPVNFPGHFLLRWNYSSDGFKELDTNLFVDVFKKGHVMTSAEILMGNARLDLLGFRPEYLNACPPRDVFRRMTANIMHLRHGISHGRTSDFDGLELQAVLSPEDFDTVMGCVKCYVERHINYTESLAMLPAVRPQNDMEIMGVAIFREMIDEAIQKDGEEDAEPTMPAPKRREDNEEVAYAVGMVMKHRRYNYSCVIYGWDPVCKLSRQWQHQMGVHRLPNQEKQPFYNVMVEDSSSRYAAQENLDFIDAPITISHPEVGRYFQEFTQKCYLPNAELACQYPDDVAVTTQKAAELYPE
ncbi:F-box only protein 21-like [Patiria miniata]|uniref:Hemimethylated DNA-binding domain-containing protein n=1 Tax=Patiria miniata TaxID=46514 RepID=A0A914BEC0_PATMI|nr:F-box only protein 21-like [Patiria miniata]